MNTALNERIDALYLPLVVKKDLGIFAEQLLKFYKEDLVSLIVIGSAAGGSYQENESDLNLLVIYSDLNIADLGVVAAIARKWLRKRRFAPRFLSRRNLVSSAKVFPMDTMDMKERHAVLFGEDIFSDITIDMKALAWQVSSELKSMRMRIKQQFWRTAGNPARMQVVLSERFSSILLLGRALLVLEKKDPGSDAAAVKKALADTYNLEYAQLETLSAIKVGQEKLKRKAGIEAFNLIMQVIRVLDDRAEALRE